MAALNHLVVLAVGWKMRASQRREAYDSEKVRRVRGRLTELYHLERLTRVVNGAGVGCWPRAWLALLTSLRRRGVELPQTTVSDLRTAVLGEVQRARLEVDQLNRELRAARRARWHAARPQLWKQRPGVVYHWLQAPMAPWGCTPMVDDLGRQCLTVEAVDQAVRGYWVDQILCQHRESNEADSWREFAASEFYSHIPVLEWPHASWSAAWVGEALRTMREGASPGLPNIPIAVWKA